MYTDVVRHVDFQPAQGRKVVFGYRDTGLDHVQQVQGNGRPGLWLGDDLTRFSRAAQPSSAASRCAW
jgi:putative ABC transport system permease protein